MFWSWVGCPILVCVFVCVCVNPTAFKDVRHLCLHSSRRSRLIAKNTSNKIWKQFYIYATCQSQCEHRYMVDDWKHSLLWLFAFMLYCCLLLFWASSQNNIYSHLVVFTSGFDLLVCFSLILSCLPTYCLNLYYLFISCLFATSTFTHFPTFTHFTKLPSLWDQHICPCFSTLVVTFVISFPFSHSHAILCFCSDFMCFALYSLILSYHLSLVIFRAFCFVLCSFC